MLSAGKAIGDDKVVQFDVFNEISLLLSFGRRRFLCRGQLLTTARGDLLPIKCNFEEATAVELQVLLHTLVQPNQVQCQVF
jgi:hypothetical protein